MPHYTVFGISMASGGEQLGEESIASPSWLSHVARGGGSTFGCWRSELLAGGSYALLRSPFLELALELGVSDGGRPLQGLDRRAEVVFEHTFDRRQNVRGDVIGLAAFLPVGQVCRGWETAVDLLEQIHHGENLAGGVTEGALRPPVRNNRGRTPNGLSSRAS
jgi:hypothetical protein